MCYKSITVDAISLWTKTFNTGMKQKQKEILFGWWILQDTYGIAQFFYCTFYYEPGIKRGSLQDLMYR